MKKEIDEIIETLHQRYQARAAKAPTKGGRSSFNALRIQLQVLADIRAELDTVDSMTAAEYTEYLNA